jgi:uncharacterized membrane protein
LSNDEQINRLSDRIESLSSEIAVLRQRVAALEQKSPALPSATLNIPSTRTFGKPAAASPSGAGLKLLNLVGALTLFIGFIFFFKYAVDNEWIGAAGRVGLGVIAGLALFATGEYIRRRGQITFAQGLTACGVATLYISAYAASQYYKLIDLATAFIGFVVISGAATAISLRTSDLVLAIVAYLGFISAPGLFRLLGASVWTWFAFIYLLVTQAFAIIQAGVQSARLLVPITAAACCGAAFWVINPHHPLVCVMFLLALAVLHFRPARRGVASLITAPQTYVIGHMLVLIGGFRFLTFWFQRIGSTETRSSLLSEADSIFLALYGVALLLSAVVRKSLADRVLGLAMLGTVVIKLYLIDVWLLARFYRVSAFVALGVLLLVGSFVYSRWKQRPT